MFHIFNYFGLIILGNKLNRCVSVIGLGYVGLPMAVAFGGLLAESAKLHKQNTVKNIRACDTALILDSDSDSDSSDETIEIAVVENIRESQAKIIGFDINQERIEKLKQGHDATGEVAIAEFTKVRDYLFLTANPEDLKYADFHIIAVPTPVDNANQPDLMPLLAASKTLGSILKKGDIVVYESTVYPGATEEDCVPVLEKYSGLTCGVDFFVGYSPERVNPGDHERSFSKITKIVSGQTPQVLEIIANVYGAVVTAGVYKASSIKVAEAAKVIENTQRDLNIALVNELAMIFHAMNIDTQEVLEAAGTKWNFLKFKPGLVGGHCIGVDPYYLTYKAMMHGYHPEVILAGRRVNDGMGRYVATQLVKLLCQLGSPVAGVRVGIFGFTFKENCADVRNTKVVDIYRELLEYGLDVSIHDPLAENKAVFEEYGIMLTPWEKMDNFSAIILAVGHEDYKRKTSAEFERCLVGKKVLMDLKHIFSHSGVDENILRWKL